MLKKICAFSFGFALICLISLVCLTPFAIKDVANTFSNIGEDFLVKQYYVVPLNDLGKINTISFNSNAETYVKLMPTDTKQDEILIRHHSVFGETVEFSVSEIGGILNIEQELTQLESMPAFFSDLKNYSYASNLVEIYFPENISINLLGGAFSFDGKSDDFIITNDLTAGDIRDLSADVSEDVINVFTSNTIDEFRATSKDLATTVYHAFQRYKLFNIIY